jgi:hypothetical protein
VARSWQGKGKYLGKEARMSWRSFVGAAVVGTAAAVITGVAVAAIPDSSGVVHACYQKVTGATKPVRLLDIGEKSTCPKGWVAVSWSQTGPSGPVGPTGATGPPGPQGPSGATTPIAYLRIAGNGTVSHSYGVVSVTNAATTEFPNAYCVSLSFRPETGSAIDENGNVPVAVWITGVSNHDSWITQYCPSGTDAVVIPPYAVTSLAQFWAAPTS